MKIDRMGNAVRNTLIAEVLTVYRALAPFVLRTALLYFLGVQYLGLNGLFASVLQVLNVAGLGVENAIVFSLYKPIAQDEKNIICALLRLYRKYYISIGLFIAAAGIGIAPFLPKLIQGEVPSDINISFAFLLYLMYTVASYMVLGYKKCLLKAHMRNDILSKVVLTVSIFTNALQLYAICILRNYYIYLGILFLYIIIANLISARLAEKMYPEYKPSGQVEGEHLLKLKEKIRDLFLVKISTVLMNSADIIVISAVMGLNILAVYQNYYFVLTTVITFVEVLFDSAIAGIGNSLVTESKEKNYTDFQMMTFIIAWVAGCCACCMLCLYQPFMCIWVGEDLLLPFGMVILFVFRFIIMELSRIISVYKDAAGMWHKDRFRPFITALLNLLLNILTIKEFGLYGVLFSSVMVTLAVDFPWLLHNIFSLLFSRNYLWTYVRSICYYLLITGLSCIFSIMICNWISYNAWRGIIVRALICLIVPNVLFLITYRKRKEFKQWGSMMKSLLRC